jgi:threonine/homoserine/homoserine lactone efflux protein
MYKHKIMIKTKLKSISEVRGMTLSLLLEGFKVGLLIATPIGPMSILCIRRSLTERLAIGITIGLAIASGDSFYAILAAASMSKITTLIETYKAPFHLVSALVIAYLGMNAIKASTPDNLRKEAKPRSLTHTYISTLLLTLASPMTILLFASLFAGLGASGTLDAPGAIPLLAIGVTLGAGTWFIMLSSVVHSMKNKISPKGLQRVNIFSGTILMAFAGYTLYTAITLFAA